MGIVCDIDRIINYAIMASSVWLLLLLTIPSTSSSADKTDTKPTVLMSTSNKVEKKDDFIFEECFDELDCKDGYCCFQDIVGLEGHCYPCDWTVKTPIISES